jgi:hypothetical protein
MKTYRWSVVLLGVLSWLPALSHAAPPLVVEPAGGATVRVTQVSPTDTGWAVRGRLRLAPEALPQPDAGRIRVESLDGRGRVLVSTEAPIYRIVTADRRARLYGFSAVVKGGLPDGGELRVRHLPSSR